MTKRRGFATKPRRSREKRTSRELREITLKRERSKRNVHNFEHLSPREARQTVDKQSRKSALNTENQNRHRCRFWLGTVLSLTKCNGFPTPLSVYLIMRHRCRVISKRHCCRSDTYLATPLSGGCSVSAVIQSKTCDRAVGCFFLLCDSGVTKQLTDRTKVTAV